VRSGSGAENGGKLMCDPLLDFPVSSSVERTDGHLDTAMKNKGVIMDQIDPEVSVDEKTEIAQGAAAIAAMETEFDPAAEIPGEPANEPDEYERLIQKNRPECAVNYLADRCRTKDMEIAKLQDQIVRMGIVAGNIRTLVDKIEIVAVGAI
jgi:hypothetical protein